MRKFCHFDFMNVGGTVKLQAVDSEEIFWKFAQTIQLPYCWGKISYRHLAEWARYELEDG